MCGGVSSTSGLLMADVDRMLPSLLFMELAPDRRDGPG